MSGAHTQPHSVPKRRGKKNTKRNTVVSLILSLAGMALLLYPLVATVIENRLQSGVVESYTENLQQFSEEELAEEVQQAKDWNAFNQGGPMLDPWLARVSEDNEAYQEYEEQLNLTEVMGRISIPSIKSDLPIYHGTSEETLKKGIGHLYGSGLPVGGTDVHSVLTGHTGLTTATLWDNLDDVVVGDAIYLDVHGEKTKYVVREIQTVLPEDTDSLQPVAGKDLLTLITCTPYGVNSHRLLVHAERVELDVKEAEKALSEVNTPWQSWMTWLAVAIVIITAWMLLEWWFARSKAKSSRAEGESK